MSRLARTYTLRISCANAWPGLIDECERAIRAVRPDNSVSRVQAPGCVAVTAYSSHWPCLFPQHGPGKKYQRRITLEPWQREIVDAHPWELVQGSCTRTAAGSPTGRQKRSAASGSCTEYPRYFFANKSVDIARLYGKTLGSLGVEWTSSLNRKGSYNISVARKASVALMDRHIGPKS